MDVQWCDDVIPDAETAAMGLIERTAVVTSVLVAAQDLSQLSAM